MSREVRCVVHLVSLLLSSYMTMLLVVAIEMAIWVCEGLPILLKIGSIEGENMRATLTRRQLLKVGATLLSGALQPALFRRRAVAVVLVAQIAHLLHQTVRFPIDCGLLVQNGFSFGTNVWSPLEYPDDLIVLKGLNFLLNNHEGGIS